MVAYSFKSRFADAIVSGRKRITVRANRLRHVKPGEAIQLYVGMRTKQCRKLLSPDPICLHVFPIVISVGETCIMGIKVNDWRYSSAESEAFAKADGFENLKDMHGFWVVEHGLGNFEGVVITWKPAESASSKSTETV
jgi:hypothetical protein